MVVTASSCCWCFSILYFLNADLTDTNSPFIKVCLRTSLVAQTVKRLSTMRETWVQSLGWEDSLEKEMAIHSSTLAWKIPQTEEPGRLQSMGSQRVRHDWATSLFKVSCHRVPTTSKHEYYCLLQGALCLCSSTLGCTGSGPSEKRLMESSQEARARRNFRFCLCVRAFQSYLTLCDRMNYSLPGPSRPLCPWDSLGKSIKVCCHALLQGIFPAHVSNPHFLSLLHWQVCYLLLTLPGKPWWLQFKGSLLLARLLAADLRIWYITSLSISQLILQLT